MNDISIITAPAQIIWLANPPAPRASGNTCWASTLPIDHPRAAIVTAMSPAVEAENESPRTSSNTPPNPAAIPAISSTEGRTPKGRLAMVINAGTIAMKATTRPEAIVCSAYATPPWLAASMTVPTTAAFRHSVRVGKARPRHQAHR